MMTSFRNTHAAPRSTSVNASFSAGVLGALILVGCAGTTKQGSTIAPPRPPPTVITEATLDEGLRRFAVMRPDAPERQALRERLVAYILSRGPADDASDPYEALVEHLATVTSLYSPEEIAQGELPPALGATAERLIALGSPRGDEGRVLSGLLVLSTTRPKDKESRELYRRIKEWGFEARAAFSSPMERFEGGLIEVWEEHARLTPTPEVLRALTRVYVDQRDPTTAMSVVAVYLRHGDVAQALTQLEQLGTGSGIEERLAEALQVAREQDAEGSSALLWLASKYGEAGRLDVSRALCVLGLRDDPNDARFYRFLAQIAAREADFAGAMGWYAEAVRLQPEERRLYDEILEVLSSLMEQGLFGADTAQTRQIAARASDILEERQKRWPDAPSPVKAEELFLTIAIAEMNAGNALEAEARLRQSLSARPTVSGFLQLGLLLERLQRGAEAADVYQKALRELPPSGIEADARRAEILERLGDTLRMQGKPVEATQAYQQGLALWDQNLARAKGQRSGLLHLRRGVLLGRLARRGDAVSAFERALEQSPEMRETYTTILAYLAVHDPDGALAHRVFRAARNQLSLDPEWKVYFALWLRLIAGRSGGGVDAEVLELLEDAAQGNDWWAHLARFAAGKLDYDGLIKAAGDDVGQRTEAFFYEGARRLGTGDKAGARQMFEQVLAGHMVNFYEFAMAQELLAQTK
jgi:tetratricopeptide (TPR) repeat protein